MHAQKQPSVEKDMFGILFKIVFYFLFYVCLC